MCCGIYIVKVNGKLAKNAVLFFFLVLQIINHHLYNCASVDRFKQKKTTLAQTQKCIFRHDNGCSSKKCKSRNDQCQVHNQQTKVQKSDLSL